MPDMSSALSTNQNFGKIMPCGLISKMCISSQVQHVGFCNALLLHSCEGHHKDEQLDMADWKSGGKQRNFRLFIPFDACRNGSWNQDLDNSSASGDRGAPRGVVRVRGVKRPSDQRKYDQ